MGRRWRSATRCAVRAACLVSRAAPTNLKSRMGSKIFACAKCPVTFVTFRSTATNILLQKWGLECVLKPADRWLRAIAIALNGQNGMSWAPISDHSSLIYPAILRIHIIACWVSRCFGLTLGVGVGRLFTCRRELVCGFVVVVHCCGWLGFVAWLSGVCGCCL